MSRPSKKSCYFILSVDTEEEWDWDGPFPDENWSVENTDFIPPFHQMVRALGVKPTYFVDYAVMQNSNMNAVFKKWQQSGECEIGAHLHPWCNPPFFTDATSEAQSHVVNLPLSQVEQKLVSLTDIIEREMGQRPISFRTGRWGINGDILRLVARHGYKIDSSVCPYYKTQFFSCDGAEPSPYWPKFDRVVAAGEQRDILEIPVTAGFSRRGFRTWAAVHRALAASVLSKIKIVGLMWHLRFLRKLYLSPELSSLENMKALLDATVASGYPVVHMYFHSSTLLPNKNSFVADEKAKQEFLSDIKKLIEYCSQRYDTEFCTLSDLLEKRDQYWLNDASASKS